MNLKIYLNIVIDFDKMKKHRLDDLFFRFLNIDFDKVRATAKAAGVTPTIAMVKHLGTIVEEMGLNKKLSADRKAPAHYLLLKTLSFRTGSRSCPPTDS